MTAFLKAALLAIASLLLPIRPLMLTVGFLVFADLLTGLMAARMKKMPITSAGFRRTVVKMAAYQVGIIAGYVLGKYLLDDMEYIAKIVAVSIGVTEFKSLTENIKIVTGKDLFKVINEAFWSSNDKGKGK